MKIEYKLHQLNVYLFLHLPIYQRLYVPTSRINIRSSTVFASAGNQRSSSPPYSRHLLTGAWAAIAARFRRRRRTWRDSYPGAAEAILARLSRRRPTVRVSHYHAWTRAGPGSASARAATGTGSAAGRETPPATSSRAAASGRQTDDRRLPNLIGRAAVVYKSYLY